jgi:ribosome-binding factor A
MSIKSYKRAERVGPVIRDVICDLLRRRVDDPRVKAVVVIQVDVSPDLRLARVYYYAIKKTVDREALQKGLESAASFLRREIGKQLELRYTPRFEFCYDETLDTARRIDDLLQGVDQTDDE